MSKDETPMAGGKRRFVRRQQQKNIRRSSGGTSHTASHSAKKTNLADESDGFGMFWELSPLVRHSMADEAQGKKKGKGRRSTNRRAGAQSRYHIRRRYHMQNGSASGSAMDSADAALMFSLTNDPFEEAEEFDEALHMAFKDESDSEDEDMDETERGPPPLENVNQMHVFFYYVGCNTEVDIVENYVSELEGLPLELKCLTNGRDFKPDLTPVQNVVLAVGLSQRTVLVCTQAFIKKDLEMFSGGASLVMAEEEKRAKILVLLSQDAELPSCLHNNRVFKLSETDALEKLTRVLSSGPVPKEQYKTEPTAPPLDTVAEEDSVTLDMADSSPQDNLIYSNGAIIKKITSENCAQYTRNGVEAVEDGNGGLALRYGRDYGCCNGLRATFCPMPLRRPEVPLQLRRRGLLVHSDEFEDMLQALKDASAVKFFQKSVQCSLPCLYLCITLLTVAVVGPMWFLSVGAVKHHRPNEDHGSAIFWSFFFCIIVVPSLMALVTLAVLIHISNEKYLKFRLKLEEFNKRFRETSLVLHCKKAFWYCSGRLKLFLIYYNFDECQQALYYQVYENMKSNGNDSTCNSSNTTESNVVNGDVCRNGYVPNGEVYSPTYGENEIPTIKMDKILKRVNTLRKKYEWDYFEDLIMDKLPETDNRQHRKNGMCFCQYVQRRNTYDVSSSWVEQMKGQCEVTLRSALRKSHGPHHASQVSNSPGNGSVLYNDTPRQAKPDIIFI